MSIKLWIISGLITAALLGGAGYTIKYFYDENQTLKTDKAVLEAKNVEATKTANKYANRPRTPDDTDQRLCQWIKHEFAKRNNSKAFAGVSDCAATGTQKP